jgi:DNA polymerase/3'-5' exonuclease PolX
MTVAQSRHSLSSAEISRRLAVYAPSLQSKGDNPFKVRAYLRAAETIKDHRRLRWQRP